MRKKIFIIGISLLIVIGISVVYFFTNVSHLNIDASTIASVQILDSFDTTGVRHIKDKDRIQAIVSQLNQAKLYRTNVRNFFESPVYTIRLWQDDTRCHEISMNGNILCYTELKYQEGVEIIKPGRFYEYKEPIVPFEFPERTISLDACKQIKKGMSEEEVLAILGAPNGIGFGLPSLRYDISDGSTVQIFLNGEGVEGIVHIYQDENGNTISSPLE